MSRSRTVRGRAALAVATVAAVVAAGGQAPSGAEPSSSDGKLRARPVIGGGLLSPLSFDVQPNGVVWVSQNFAGLLMRKAPGGPLRTVATARNGELGAVSLHQGVVTYAVSRGDNEVGLIRQIRNGRNRLLADVGAFERGANPDRRTRYGFVSIGEACAGQLPRPARYRGVEETHPYGTTTKGRTVYVADAGANAIFAIGPRGRVSTVAALPAAVGTVTPAAAEGAGFPDCTIGKRYRFEAVPTDIELGPDGMLYVSTLPGGPEDGSAGRLASVYRVNPRNGRVVKVIGGLVSATGLAVAPNGTIYVSQLFPGTISRFRQGSRRGSVFASRPFPAAVELAQGRVYATVNVFSGLSGEPGDRPDARVLTWSRGNPPG